MRTAGLIIIALSLSLPVAAEEMPGAEVYQSTCSACHGSGKFNAPKFGDRKRWKKLLAEGLDEIVPEALRGVRKMPAKGGNAALSDLEVARAVVYMANAGGGRLAEPTMAEAERWRHMVEAGRKR